MPKSFLKHNPIVKNPYFPRLHDTYRNEKGGKFGEILFKAMEKDEKG